MTISSANLISAACGVTLGTQAVLREHWWWAALFTVLTAALIVEGLWRGRKRPA